MPFELPDSTANIVGAAAGAAIAVLGAIVATDYRERAQRRELVTILIAGLRELWSAADEFDDRLHSSSGVDISTGVLPIISRWEHLAAFSPYRELGDFRLVTAMAEVDAICRQIVPLAEPPPSNPNPSGFLGAAVYLRSNRQGRASSLVQELKQVCRHASAELRRV